MFSFIRNNSGEVIILKSKIINLIIFALICTVVVLYSGGCKKNPEKSSPKSEINMKELDKEPEEIQDIKKSIKHIFLQVDNKKIAIEHPEKNQDMKSSDKKQNPNDTNKEEGKKEEEGMKDTGEKEKKDYKQDSEKEQDPMKDWQKEENEVKTIHEKWNAAEVSVAKLDTTGLVRKEFEKNLTLLTNMIMEKDLMGALKASNELYGNTVSASDLYKDNKIAKAEMMEYYAVRGVLQSEELKWPEAVVSAKSLKEQAEKVAIIFSGKDSESLEKLNYAIEDYAKAVNEQNLEVAKIKGDVVVSNVDRVIKEIQKIKKNDSDK